MKNENYKRKLVLPKYQPRHLALTPLKSKNQQKVLERLPKPIISRIQDSHQKPKIKLCRIGPGQIFGDDDALLQRRYSASLRCVSRDSKAYLMGRTDFLRMFKGNEEAWKTMFAVATEKESKLFDRCYTFVNINNEEKTTRNIRGSMPDELEINTKDLFLDKIKQEYGKQS